MSKSMGLDSLRLTVQAIMQMLRKKADANKVVSSVNGIVPDKNGNVAVDIPEGSGLPDNEEVIQSLLDMGMLPAVLNDDNEIMTDESGNILLV